MKKLLIFFTAGFMLFSCGNKAKQDFPDEINTVKRSLHVNIPGTRVFIALPEGFYISDDISAIQSGKQAVIQVLEMEGFNFYSNPGNQTRQQYERQGIKLLEYKDLKLNGHLARIAHFDDNDETGVYNFTFGDSTFSVVIVATFKLDNKEITEDVKQALLSVYYDKNHVINYLETAHFELDDSKSLFKFGKFGASVYMYSIGGVKKTSYENEPHFMVLTAPAGGESLPALAESLANMLADRSTKNASQEPTNGLRSYKREVYGKKDGKPTALFQHIVVIRDKVIVMQGITDTSISNYMAEFKKLSATIKPNKKR